MKRLRDVLEARDVRLATEAEIANLFPDCQVGTMPPFGNLYGVEVYVDQLLTEDESIVFEAGTYVGAIKLRYKDFAALVRPKVAAFHHEPSKISCISVTETDDLVRAMASPLLDIRDLTFEVDSHAILDRLDLAIESTGDSCTPRSQRLRQNHAGLCPHGL